MESEHDHNLPLEWGAQSLALFLLLLHGALGWWLGQGAFALCIMPVNGHLRH
jgi:hypothetical protein